MLVYFDKEQQEIFDKKGRYHPWTTGTYGDYVDFKQCPQRIADTLEDLQPIAGTSAAQAIVDFIAWANGHDSTFETNDFGLRPLKSNESGKSPSALELHGRIVLFFRDLKLNTVGETVAEFLSRVEHELRTGDAGFHQACWGLCKWPHAFVELEDSGLPAEGSCVAFLLWAWGDDEAEVHNNLIRAFRNLRFALETVADTRQSRKRGALSC